MGNDQSRTVNCKVDFFHERKLYVFGEDAHFGYKFPKDLSNIEIEFLKRILNRRIDVTLEIDKEGAIRYINRIDIYEMVKMKGPLTFSIFLNGQNFRSVVNMSAILTSDIREKFIELLKMEYEQTNRYEILEMIQLLQTDSGG